MKDSWRSRGDGRAEARLLMRRSMGRAEGCRVGALRPLVLGCKGEREAPPASGRAAPEGVRVQVQVRVG